MIRTNHPNLRRSTSCPFCAKPKERGLRVCWECNRHFNIRHGSTERVLLDFAERVESGEIVRWD
jgi:predicted amidophosphoribosyltransferase